MPPTAEPADVDAGRPFLTVFGRGLVGELPNFVHAPYLVVTMADLWPLFEASLSGPSLAGVHLVDTIELEQLDHALDEAAAVGERDRPRRRSGESTSPSSSPGGVAFRCSRCRRR